MAIFPLPDTLSLSVIVQTGHVTIILDPRGSYQSVGWARPPFVTSDKESGLAGERARSQVRVLWVLLDSSASYDTIGYSVDMSPPSSPQIKCEMRTRLFGEFTDAIHPGINTQLARDACLKPINEHGCGTGT